MQVDTRLSVGNLITIGLMLVSVGGTYWSLETKVSDLQSHQDNLVTKELFNAEIGNLKDRVRSLREAIDARPKSTASPSAYDGEHAPRGSDYAWLASYDNEYLTHGGGARLFVCAREDHTRSNRYLR